MNNQNASATQDRHVVSRVAEGNSRFNRKYSGLLASVGFTTLLLVSAPALAFLGTAANFAVLGATPNVTNTGPTVVSGNVGVYPAASITGFPPGSIVAGTGFLHMADAVAQQAQADNLTAFGTLTAGAGAAIGPALGGQTLTPGTYDAGAANLTGTLTINGPGTYIIRTTSLTTSAGSTSSVSLTNGASPCDVWWTSSSSVSIGTGSVMAGNILAHTSITIGTGASLAGRALAYTGTVTMDSNGITACSGGSGAYVVAGPVAIPPPVAATGVPTLSEWAMIMLVALLAITGFVAMRRQTK